MQSFISKFYNTISPGSQGYRKNDVQKKTIPAVVDFSPHCGRSWPDRRATIQAVVNAESRGIVVDAIVLSLLLNCIVNVPSGAMFVLGNRTDFSAFSTVSSTYKIKLRILPRRVLLLHANRRVGS